MDETDSLVKITNPADEAPRRETRVVVVAHNAEEMGRAQVRLVEWADAMVKDALVDRDELRANVEIAEANDWRSTSLKAQAAKAQKRFEFYEKIKAALEAGYTIIPNITQDADIFAVRTSASHPAGGPNRPIETRAGSRDTPPDQRTNVPALGEGKYVDPQATIGESESFSVKEKNYSGAEIAVTKVNRWAEDFRDPQFPFLLAKPEVLKSTQEAMALGIFDEMIASPRWRRTRSDPMIMGRVVLGSSWSRKVVTFLVSWFVDTRMLGR